MERDRIEMYRSQIQFIIQKQVTREQAAQLVAALIMLGVETDKPLKDIVNRVAAEYLRAGDRVL